MAIWQATVDIIRTHWGLGSHLLSDMHMPGADAAARAWFARLQHEAATPEMAAALLLNRLNSGNLAENVVVPTLVLHRRSDLAVAFEDGRRLAAMLPNARLVPLEGDVHLPFLGDSDALVRAILDFCGEPAAVKTPATSGLATSAPLPASVPTAADGLSPREMQVLRLLAAGESNKEIAAALAVSVATAERHIANLYGKIGARGRADAIAYAHRHGLGAAAQR
jgi:DNA-binding CsgD family transcriptional regulator